MVNNGISIFGTHFDHGSYLGATASLSVESNACEHKTESELSTNLNAFAGKATGILKYDITESSFYGEEMKREHVHVVGGDSSEFFVGGFPSWSRTVFNGRHAVATTRRNLIPIHNAIGNETKRNHMQRAVEEYFEDMQLLVNMDVNYTPDVSDKAVCGGCMKLYNDANVFWLTILCIVVLSMR